MSRVVWLCSHAEKNPRVIMSKYNHRGGMFSPVQYAVKLWSHAVHNPMLLYGIQQL